MKFLAFLNLLVAHSIATKNLTSDFLHGFETGLLLRDDKHALDDFNCPVPEAEIGFLKSALGMVAPIQLMANMQAD